jgi:DNA-binding cell septation regulator SpoVG
MNGEITITSVKVYPFDTLEAGGSVLAMAEIVIGGALLIKGFRIVSTSGGGMFVGFPSSKGRDDKWRDLVIAKNERTKSLIRNTIMVAYKEFVNLQP